MQLISAWKNSLRSLNFENVKQLFRNVLTALPRIYGNWLVYSLPIIALIALITFIHLKFVRDILYSEQLLLLSISLLSCFAAITLCAITIDALYHRKFHFASYKKHLIIGTVLLAIPVFLVWWYISPISLFEKLFKSHIVFYQKMAPKLVAGKHISPEFFKSFEQDVPRQIFLLTLSILCMGLTILMQFGSYILFFFLDTTGSLQDFLKTILKTIRFIFVNLPFLAVFYVTILGSIFLFNRVLNLDALLGDNFYWAIFLYIIEPILLMPIFVALAGAIYKQYKDRTM